MRIAMLTVLLLGMLVTPVAGQVEDTDGDRAFVVSMTIHQNDTVSNVSAATKPGGTYTGGGGDYTFTLQDGDGSTLHETATSISFLRHTFVGTKVDEKKRFTARLPYDPSATTMSVEHNGAEIAAVSLPGQLCSPVENGNCPAYCEDKGIDPDCTTGGALNGLNPIHIAFGVLAVLIIGVAVYQTILSGEQGTESRPQGNRQDRRNQSSQRGHDGSSGQRRNNRRR